MKNYIKINFSNFKLLKPGDYIRWEKVTDEGLSKGASILRIGNNKGKKNWRLLSGSTEFTLYWENVNFVYLRKHAYFSVLEEKINILSSTLIFLIKKLDMMKEFSEFNEKMKTAISNLDQK